MKILKLILKILGIAVGSVVALFVLAICVLSIAKYFIYPDYFPAREKTVSIPGLNSGYVPQGLSWWEEKNAMISTGYMSNGSPSRIYVIDAATDKAECYLMYSNGEPFTGHTGGVQYLDGEVFVASGSLYRFPASRLDGSGKVEIGAGITTNNQNSFVWGKGNDLYTGEFHRDGTQYICDHEMAWNGKTNYAIITKYNKNDLTKPLAVYSVPQNVQGFTITDEGYFVLSTSWGLNPSQYMVYGPEAIVKTDMTCSGAPVWFLSEPTANLKGTPMAEDLDMCNGKVITSYECASNKYVIGKFFQAFRAVELDIDGYVKKTQSK